MDTEKFQEITKAHDLFHLARLAHVVARDRLQLAQRILDETADAADKAAGKCERLFLLAQVEGAVAAGPKLEGPSGPPDSLPASQMLTSPTEWRWRCRRPG